MSQANRREQQKGEEEEKKPEQQNQLKFIWIVLGIGAILLIWLLSSWVYR